ncbi:MAG: hypothetical protein Q4A27_01345 [bacterium]|nr:hypothetical protein [bacterium]MDO4872059.1 hypothetical protein [bacterium]
MRKTTLRAIRKTSHITKNIGLRGVNFLGKVENKATFLINNGILNDSVKVDDVFYAKYPHLTPIYPSLPELGQKPSVTVFAFLHPAGFFGGIATLLFTAAKLANELNYDLRVVQTTGYSDKVDVVKFLNENGIEFSKERYSTLNLSNRSNYNYGYLPLHEDDVVMVSAWWDARIASELPLKNKFVYLIQDFEPIFYNNSDAFTLSDETYRTEKFLPITNTEILLEYFKKNKYTYISKNAVFFEPAPSPNVKLKKFSKTKKSKKIFLYGRPNVDRNMFYTAIKALDLAVNDERLADYNIEIYSAGSAEVPNIELSNGSKIKNQGKMPLDEYYKFVQTVDVAVSPMLAPHPNYPTLEFSSVGATVVTTKWETKQNLDRYSKNIFMCEPTISDMADKIVQAIIKPVDEVKKDAQENNLNKDWNVALNEPIKKLAKKLQIKK